MRSELPRFAKFCHDHLRHTHGVPGGPQAGDPFEPEQFQLDYLEELLQLDKAGKRVYSESVYAIPRKNGKSSLLAAFALYALVADPFNAQTRVYVAAASRDQANETYDYARLFVSESPTLSRSLRIVRSEKMVEYWVGSRLKGRLQVVSSEAGNVHGKNPTTVIIDEVHAHQNDDLYIALTTGSAARSSPLILLTSTAGGNKKGILGKKFDEHVGGDFDIETRAEGALSIVRNPAARTLFWWYAVPDEADIDDMDAVKLANPAPWVTTEYLGVQREKLRRKEADFRKYHCNQWASADGAWLEHGAWQALAEADADLIDGEPIVLGVDVASKHDNSAIVAITERRDDGRRRVKAWIYQPEDGVFMPDAVESRIRSLAARYSVVEVAFDPWRFETNAHRLQADDIPVVEFPQTPERMTRAVDAAKRMVLNAEVVHDGDADFSRHIANAVARDGPRGIVLDKNKSSEKIDAAVAFCMAAARADALDSAQPFFFLVGGDS